jgi:uncharacterized protein (TIGR01244 family)
MKPSNLIAAAVALCSLPVLVSCTREESQAAPAPAPSAKLEPATCGQVQRLHTLGSVFLASQPSSEDFERVRETGIKRVLDLRMPDEERGFDEPARVEELGMTYVHLGFKAADTLTDEVLDRSRELMRGAANEPLMVHCASANRVGAVWLAHRVLDGGQSWDAALAEAKTVGLSNPGYEAKVKDYVERHR